MLHTWLWLPCTCLPAPDFAQDAMDTAGRRGPPRCYFSPREVQFLKEIITKHGSDYAVSETSTSDMFLS